MFRTFKLDFDVIFGYLFRKLGVFVQIFGSHWSLTNTISKPNTFGCGKSLPFMCSTLQGAMTLGITTVVKITLNSVMLSVTF
jgi:hypothetical protein